MVYSDEDVWVQNKYSKLLALSSVLTCSIQFSSVARSCPSLCDSMDSSTLGFAVHHQILEPTETHVHCISDAI